MPIPPSLAGRLSRSRSRLEQGDLPVSVGIIEGLVDFSLQWLKEILNIWDCSHKIGPTAGEAVSEGGISGMRLGGCNFG